MNNLDKGRGSERERELDRLCFEPGVEKKKKDALEGKEKDH